MADLAKEWEESTPVKVSKEDWDSAEPVKDEKVASNGVGRQIGLTARAGIRGAATLGGLADLFALPATMAGNKSPSEAIDSLLTKAGLPEAETKTERFSQDVAGAMFGTGALGMASKAVGTLKNAVAEKIRQTFYENMGGQLGATAAAAGGSSVAKEAGVGPVGQMAAGLGAAMVPSAVSQSVQAGGRALLARDIEKNVGKVVTRPDGQKVRVGVGDYAKEGSEIAESTGIELTPGPRSGSRRLVYMENVARQYPATVDQVQAVDLKIANQAVQAVEKLAGKQAGSVDPEQIGTRIQDVVKSAAERIVRDRKASADVNYGAVRQIAGDAPVIQMNNVVQALDNIISRYSGVAGDEAKRIVSKVTAMRNELTVPTPDGGTAPKVLDINKAMRNRSTFNENARGSGNLFDDLAPNRNRQIASELSRAIDSDFDAPITRFAPTGTDGEAIQGALKKANADYKAKSQSLEFLEKSSLGKLIGDDVVDAAISGRQMNTVEGKKVFDFFRNTSNGSRKVAMEIIERENPQLANELRSAFIIDALDKSMVVPPSTKGASQVPLSTKEFIKNFRGNNQRLSKTMESWGFSKDQITEAENIIKAMERQGDMSGFNTSGTAVSGWAERAMKALTYGAGGAKEFAGFLILKTIGMDEAAKRVAMAMENPTPEAMRRVPYDPSRVPSPGAVISGASTNDFVRGKDGN